MASEGHFSSASNPGIGLVPALAPSQVRLRSWHHRESPNGEGAHPFNPLRNGEEIEPLRRKRFEAREVLDDRDLGRKQDRVYGPLSRMRPVDVDRIDPDQRCSTRNQGLRCRGGQVRVALLTVAIGPPVT